MHARTNNVGENIIDAKCKHSQFEEWSTYLNDALELDDKSVSQIRVALNQPKDNRNVQSVTEKQDENSYADVSRNGLSSATTVSYISDGVVSVVVNGRHTDLLDSYINPDISGSTNSLHSGQGHHLSNRDLDTPTSCHELTTQIIHQVPPMILSILRIFIHYDNNNNIINIRDANKSTPAHQLAARERRF